APADSGVPPLPQETCLDNDGDGYPGTGQCDDVENVDCNDADPDVHPEAAEVCNGLDDNCDGNIDEGLAVVTWYPDKDGDDNAAVKPGAAELCNGIDDNCDGLIDNGIPFQNFYPDKDGDGFGDAMAMPTSS